MLDLFDVASERAFGSFGSDLIASFLQYGPFLAELYCGDLGRAAFFGLGMPKEEYTSINEQQMCLPDRLYEIVFLGKANLLPTETIFPSLIRTSQFSKVSCASTWTVALVRITAASLMSLIPFTGKYS